jgi:putative transcriptional regulator
MESLTNHFLIAMPNLADPNFHRTVTFICQHNEDGALGIVINRVTNIQLQEVFDQMNIPTTDTTVAQTPVYSGGPVQTERGFILHEGVGGWDATLPIGDHLGLTTSRDILEAMAQNQGPRDCLVALGYAGWGGGQLEQELSENAWLNGPADYDIVFRTPVEERWNQAARLLGVDINQMSGEAGHA